MVALWKHGQEILATKAEQKWEEEGGRWREFLELAVELHELLDRPGGPTVRRTTSVRTIQDC